MTTTDDSMQKSIKRHDRSRAYPFLGFGDALKKTANINSNLGLNGQFNRESIAVGMGYSGLNGASARAVAALVHYGLLDRVKDQYSLSKTAKQYLLPTSDEDQVNALRQAALSPTLFTEIYEGFKGQIIPKQFKNRLIQEFGIQQKVAGDVEQIFKESMQTAGLLQPNGILTSELLAKQIQNMHTGAVGSSGEDSKFSPHPADDINPDFLSFNLPSGLRIGYSQELASAFAFGQFGVQLKALDEAVSVYVKEKVNTESPGTEGSEE